jgi:hypothetical protein
VAIRQLLGSGDVPPAVAALENQFPYSQRLRIRFSGSKVFWAIVAALTALLTWLGLTWLLVQVRERQALRTSFYNVELEHLRQRGRDGRAR